MMDKLSGLLMKIKKKTRDATIMAKLTKVHNMDNKLSLEFDNKTWTCYGKNASLLGVMRRSLDIAK